MAKNLDIVLKFPMDLDRFFQILTKFLNEYDGEIQPSFNLDTKTLTVFDITESDEKDMMHWIRGKFAENIEEYHTTEVSA